MKRRSAGQTENDSIWSAIKKVGFGERGDVMLWVVVAAPFLLTGTIGLVSASQHWEARREAHAVAAAAARSAAQADPVLSRSDSPALAAKDNARQRALDFVASQSGSETYSASVDVSQYPDSVAVTVSSTVDYTFPGFGLPAQVEGTASAAALEGVIDGEPFEG